MEKFKTIDKDVQAELIEKKSKFIANAFYVGSVKEAEEKIKETKKKYHDARHNTYAYITFDEENNLKEKCSDDGEPSGTAGSPILSILKGMGLCNILVVVTRYFGGILLGTGGLVRAYSGATTSALDKASLKIKEKGVKARIIMPYQSVETIKNYARKNNINIVKEEYLENVEFFIETTKEEYEKMISKNDIFFSKETKIQKMEEKYT